MEEIEGDLYEDYLDNLESKGAKKARKIYTWTAFRSIRPYILIHNKENRKPKFTDMVKYHFKVAWRNFLKNSLYSTVNILGLSLGLASTILISIFIIDQAQTDNQLIDRDRIYRLETIAEDEGQSVVKSRTHSSIAPALFNEIPEIENFVRFSETATTFKSKIGNTPSLIEEKILSADVSFFQIFSFELTSGNKTDALSRANYIVLSERAALKYFNSTDVVGEILETTNKRSPQLEVSGVMKNMPTNSSIQYDFIIPKSTNLNPPINFRSMLVSRIPSYFFLKAQTTPEQVLKKANNILKKYTDKENILNLKFQLTPFKEVIYNMDASDGTVKTIDKALTQIFLIIAVFIILLAFINYLNLATARAIDRGHEIGIRKVIGAKRSNLWGQFLSESLLCTLLSIPVIFLLIEFSTPYFENIIGHPLTFKYYNSPEFIFAALGLIIFIGLLAGIYPAKLISTFKFSEVVKGHFNKTAKGGLLRKILVVFQFAFSIGLIVSISLIQKQLDFARTKSFSFNPEEIISVEGRYRANFSTIRDEFSKVSGVKHVSASDAVPGTRAISIINNSEFDFPIYGVFVDDGFIDMFELEVLKGQNFREVNEDAKNHLLINQAMAKAMEIENPLGAKLRMIGKDTSRVIGVIEDFHIASLHNPVDPTVFIPLSEIFSIRRILVKLETGDLTTTLQGLEETWNKFFPDAVFQFDFLDDKIEQLYTAEMKVARIFKLFTVLAIFISCLGLFSYASYAIQVRTKEISIRKVFGASIPRIAFMLSRQVILLIILASIIASPLAYYFLGKWLQDFAYKVPVSLEIFGFAIIISVAIAWLTVSYQTLKVAFSNPINSLRNE